MTATTGIEAPVARVTPAPRVEQTIRFLSGPNGALFCSLHAPEAGAFASLVICPPLLADQAFSYRRELLLAQELARRGVAVWRFHYAGTGYSDGAQSATSFDTMVADARHVIEAAAAAARSPLAVGGIRGGALVAAAAGDDRGLVLWAPIADGATYLREGFRARMIADGGQLGRTPPTSDELLAELRSAGRIELLGYSVHEALYDSIARLRLHDLIKVSGERVLVCEGRPAEAWWFHRTQGNDHAAVASELADVISPWLTQSVVAHAVTAPAGRGTAEPLYIRTRASPVFAVLTPPSGPARGEAAVLLWGGSGIPAFGRNQVATILARRLADRGYHVLQVDYPGRGESPGPEPPEPIDEPAKQEVFAAVRATYDWLRSRGLVRVLAIGSCQGAVAALNTAGSAPSLVGLALLAPPIAERFEDEIAHSDPEGEIGALHPRMRESFARLAHTGTPTLLAYGVHDEGFRSFEAAMAGELGSILKRGAGRLTVTLTEERMHGFMTVSGQEATIEIVLSWLDRLDS